jgi:hypothetical protein
VLTAMTNSPAARRFLTLTMWGTKSFKLARHSALTPGSASPQSYRNASSYAPTATVQGRRKGSETTSYKSRRFGKIGSGLLCNVNPCKVLNVL